MHCTPELLLSLDAVWREAVELMRSSMAAETQVMYALHISVYEKILTPHQVARMHARVQPWWADVLAIIQVLGEFAARAASPEFKSAVLTYGGGHVRPNCPGRIWLSPGWHGKRQA